MLITKLRKIYCWVCVEKNFKISEYLAKLQARMWMSRALVRLANILLKDGESAWNNHIVACNIAKYWPILKNFFTDRLSNKPYCGIFQWKKFLKLVKKWQIYGHESVAPVFLAHPVYYNARRILLQSDTKNAFSLAVTFKCTSFCINSITITIDTMDARILYK